VIILLETSYDWTCVIENLITFPEGGGILFR